MGKIASMGEAHRLATALVRALAISGPGATLVEIKSGGEEKTFVIRYRLEGVMSKDDFEAFHRHLAEGQSDGLADA
jgi:hypothetical protein